ncbi:MAG: SMP-30/gluconolactonase/LRE family protein [Pseudorhizobium sp.]
MNNVFDDRPCALGEGAFWHPERQQLFWFDIVNNLLLSQEDGKPLTWAFDENVSAAGWISKTELLIASQSALWQFDLASGRRQQIVAFAHGPQMRSNDGRADPWGGFWIGTMGTQSQDKAGAIWRYYRGEMRKLYPGISITNSICFDRQRSRLYFADTRIRKIWQVQLDAAGWPAAEPALFVDLTEAGLSPDGAIVDAAGNLWSAQWGAHRVACYAPDGKEIAEVRFAASRITCPAFGGADLGTLFATSACQGMSQDARVAEPYAGMTFSKATQFQGVAEPRVVLG